MGVRACEDGQPTIKNRAFPARHLVQVCASDSTVFRSFGLFGVSKLLAFVCSHSSVSWAYREPSGAIVYCVYSCSCA